MGNGTIRLVLWIPTVPALDESFEWDKTARRRLGQEPTVGVEGRKAMTVRRLEGEVSSNVSVAKVAELGLR